MVFIYNVFFALFQPDNAPSDGIIVSRIAEGGPADRRGMRLHDQIIQVSLVCCYSNTLDLLLTYIQGQTLVAKVMYWLLGGQ